ncbi:ATP synthase F1 subunit gamma [Mesomycoplasma neurolyticum]|uniref:ATP synthase gamma chain n=1 Tax=Mesomycoplasma neurolyticum TaxID=2120 RepID=A0A449A4T6_9BACT|nr:ATP synthase F1 subunit gamma [Mesomycoplasma neurolyticum]VEU59249.1 ATP synthase gamma chain [Mesomycoplasma neurolyticum]
MESLNLIKNRIQLIENIKKITNAMELLATAKFKKIQKEAEVSKTFANSLIEIVNNSFKNSDLNKYLKQFKQEKKTIYIIIGSDLGLCGSYNINIIKKIKELVQKKDKIIVFGTKINNFLINDYNEQIIKKIIHYGDNIEYGILDDVISILIDLLMNNEINEIKIIYTKFINSVTFNSEVQTLFPLESKENDNKKNIDIEYVPSFKEVVERIVPFFLKATIFNFLIESKISEMASRRIAMENATSNASDIIVNLKIDYNKRRQADITKEITEIISGTNN